jgi:hypothetical protein
VRLLGTALRSAGIWDSKDCSSAALGEVSSADPVAAACGCSRKGDDGVVESSNAGVPLVSGCDGATVCEDSGIVFVRCGELTAIASDIAGDSRAEYMEPSGCADVVDIMGLATTLECVNIGELAASCDDVPDTDGSIA